MSLMPLFRRDKNQKKEISQGRNERKMFRLNKYKHKNKNLSNNEMNYLRRLHLKIYLSQLNMINELLLMRMLLMLVRARNTLPKELGMGLFPFLINTFFIYTQLLQYIKEGDKMLNTMLSFKTSENSGGHFGENHSRW